MNYFEVNGGDFITEILGNVFNIQKFSVHDGPGIRTIVFLKGCSLHCQWCSNPEGINMHSQIMYKEQKCISVNKCGLCVQSCPQNIISVNKGFPLINRDACINCGECAAKCPAKAIEYVGKLMSVDEVLAVVNEDETFYTRSDGGVTLSGGEPLLQAKFAVAVLTKAHEQGLHTAIETCGNVAWEQAERVFDLVDFIHYDIKSIDNNKHIKYTTASNELILSNLKKLFNKYPDKPILIRTPVIPMFNDSAQEIQQIVNFIEEYAAEVKNVQYELLPYHHFGENKYGFLGEEYLFKEIPNMDKGHLEKLKQELNTKITLL